MLHQKYWTEKVYPPKRIMQKMQTDKFIKPKTKIIIENWMLYKQK